MSARNHIEYEVDQGKESDTRSMLRVSGYPLTAPEGIPGTYALRKVTDHFWVVDHIDTGCMVCSSNDREDAIDQFRLLALRHGTHGFALAITQAQKRLQARKAVT